MDSYIRGLEIGNNHNLIKIGIRMRTLSMYVWSLYAVLVIGFTSCGDDDELNFSDEQLAYINTNREYIWEKKAEKAENGELKYQQVVMGGDTVLYRIVKKENDWTTTPSATSTVYLNELEGTFIDGQVFQPKSDLALPMNGIIPGLAGVLLHIHLDETVETIIPASLGYGYGDRQGIAGGSTLIFTFTLDKVEN